MTGLLSVKRAFTSVEQEVVSQVSIPYVTSGYVTPFIHVILPGDKKRLRSRLVLK